MSSTADYLFQIADSSWLLSASDSHASESLARFAGAMQLPPIRGSIEMGGGRFIRRIIAVTQDQETASPPQTTERICYLKPADAEKPQRWNFYNCLQISLALTQDFPDQQAVLMHGALAELQGKGVLFIGPCGRGKSTTISRLPPPWRALTDDASLVVCDTQGKWWAHPWPTWSRFIDNGLGGSWPVSERIPLHGIFLLEQAPYEAITPMGSGEALVALIHSAEQIVAPMKSHINNELALSMRQRRFNLLATLSKSVSTYILRLSLTGQFWLEIAKVLEENHL